MTIIVGLIDQGVVYMGADTVASNGTRYVKKDSKITKMLVKRPYKDARKEIAYKRDHILIGSSGSIRPSQVIGAMDAPDWPAGKDAYQYLIGTFVNAMRSALSDAGCMGKSDDQTDKTDLTILVGIDGRLFTIWQDFSVMELVESYAAVGSGADVALGALAATADSPYSAERIAKALKAVVTYDIYCGGPIDVTDEEGNIIRFSDNAERPSILPHLP